MSVRFRLPVAVLSAQLRAEINFGVWLSGVGVVGVHGRLAGVVRPGTVVGAEVGIGQTRMAGAGATDAVAARMVGEPGCA